MEHERSELSLSFFKKNALKFAENQGMIVERCQYSPILEELISSLNLPSDSSVVEIGPGEGFLLVKLAQMFNQVTGIDNSAEMLRKAKESVNDANLDNVKFIHEDANLRSTERARVNLVIMDMVLHHLPSPASVFSSVELENWAVLADLEPLQSINLALKNGFQVQISLFRAGP